MNDKPEIIKNCRSPSLFPTVEGEQRVLSIFLAVLTQTPSLLSEVMDTIGIKTSKKTKIQAYTEVEFEEKFQVEFESDFMDEKKKKGFPDGFIVVSYGQDKQFSALIEAKIKDNPLESRQVYHYAKIAQQINKYSKANSKTNIDAVITISNDFVSRADHSPVRDQLKDKRKWPKNIALYHWSWTSLLTHCRMLLQNSDSKSEIAGQIFLLQQLESFFDNSDSVQRFVSMGGQWKNLMQNLMKSAIHDSSMKNFEQLSDIISSWISEERDICLWLTKLLGVRVTPTASKVKIEDRLKNEKDYLRKNFALVSEIKIPDCSSPISIHVGLSNRITSISMIVVAPTDKKKAITRIEWLLARLEDIDLSLNITALGPKGFRSNSPKQLELLRDNPAILLDNDSSSPPSKFEIKMIREPSNRFMNPKFFIEDLEKDLENFCAVIKTDMRKKK